MALRLREREGSVCCGQASDEGKGTRGQLCTRARPSVELERNGRQPKHAGTHLMLYSRRWVGEKK